MREEAMTMSEVNALLDRALKGSATESIDKGHAQNTARIALVKVRIAGTYLTAERQGHPLSPEAKRFIR